ncbi:MAG: hypothetical protein LBJ01_10400, partial [Tannerella sp.]|nr:hypothetical protein [Tannerella sp.]
HSETPEFEIITQFPYDDGTQMPGGALIPQPGDEYILYNIRMPEEYYRIAEAEFAQAVADYMEKNKSDKTVYKAPTDYIDLENRRIELTLGQTIRLESAEFFPETGYRLSRISRITRKVNNPLQADIEISDTVDRGKMAALEGSIDQATRYVKTSLGGLPDIIKSWEGTLPTDTNLLSARATLLKIVQAIGNYAKEVGGKFLRKDIHDTAEELLTFLKGIEVFGEAIVAVLKVDGEAVFRDVLSSGDFTSGFPGGTGWALFWKEILNAAGQTSRKAVMELDEVTVRSAMRVYELIISQLSGENGTRITSDMMRVHSIDPPTRTLYLDTEKGVLYNPFRQGDILMARQFSPDGGGRAYELRVETATVGAMAEGEDRIDAISYSHFTGSENDVRPRDILTRVDSVSNADRKGIIKTTSVENGAPYMDVLYGMKTDPDNALKVRLGRLSGIISHLWGQLKGYGLYGENAYLTGEFRLKTGEDVRTRFEVMEGKLQSAMQSVVTTLSEKDNYLKNATFRNDMEFWDREHDIRLYDIGGDPIDLNVNFFSEKNKIADIDSFDGRYMLRIRDSYIRQPNVDITKPEEDDTIYLTIRYYCTEAGR